jgi:hypothetical protein
MPKWRMSQIMGKTGSFNDLWSNADSCGDWTLFLNYVFRDASSDLSDFQRMGKTSMKNVRFACPRNLSDAS